MRIYDVTASVRSGMPVYHGDPEVRLSRVGSIADGDTANVSLLSMGTHTGTHVDPPSHIIQGGISADALPLDAMIGPAVVIDAVGLSGMDADALSLLVPEGAKRLLLKTGGDGWLTKSAASWLAASGLKLAGIDSASVDAPHAAGLPAHHALLEAGVVVVEGLALSEVPHGEYELICLPLKLADGDGAPARVVLRELG